MSSESFGYAQAQWWADLIDRIGLDAAVEQRPAPLLPFNPCAGIRLPRHDDTEIEIFDNDEWELFEQLLGQRWGTQAGFGLVPMARPGKIGELQVRTSTPSPARCASTRHGRTAATA
ncbi:hypothetical protein [Nocardia farcinica]|uniref:hypothetical protein n=1 Tax=Nocardia farcinica TaxID=37329 RepID=UPI0024587DC8|nr:hypothetical protein [Nocardia farcinica]